MVASLQTVAERVAHATGMTPRAVVFLAAMVLALAFGTVVRHVRQRLAPTSQSKDLIDSLKTWWALLAALVAALVFGRTGIVIAMAILSLLAVREFLLLMPRHWIPRKLVLLAYLLVPLQYVWIWLGWEPMSLWFTPLAALVTVPAIRMASAPPSGFVTSVGSAILAILLCVYGLSYVALLCTLPASSNPAGGSAGWLLFLLLITEVNDMGQALWGRAIGVRKATPHISPNKTWEGFVGGILTTLVLAAALAPWITPLAQTPPPWTSIPVLNLPFFAALTAGAIIATGGSIGDLTMSSCKRDRGVKDFGTLLPGHGGVLDRFDSLTMTAPLFFHLVRYFDY